MLIKYTILTAYRPRLRGNHRSDHFYSPRPHHVVQDMNRLLSTPIVPFRHNSNATLPEP